MSDLRVLLIAIPALPLAAAVVIACFGKRLLGQRSHIPLAAAIGMSCALSLMLVYQVHSGAEAAGNKGIGYEHVEKLWTWVAVDRAIGSPGIGSAAKPQAADFRVEVALRADPLTAAMLAMVTFVSLLVVIYAAGYMQGDPGYWRFFAYVGLFVFSMTMLVSVSNFILLYVFWEAVGLCSYLLIGFWFQKPEAAAAGKKAFLVNRVGDCGFALGVFLIWITYGTLNFHDTVAHGVVEQMGILGQSRLASPGAFATGGVATAICLLLMLGACGKSAQFPLHVWLPDAMEGPTPVSALIHAATMVTAGVYMVARCAPLFLASTDALPIVSLIGGFTALLAALIAMTQTDLKRILAYSTISQLGYMFLGLGVGSLLGIVSGMFHLITHAFFKALLFLGAGSIMHAMGGVIDIRQLGGLRRRLPTTHWTFLFGCLALAGVFPFAGFWSKDAILEAVADGSRGPGGAFGWYGVLYLSAMVTAFLTAFYTFRAYFVTFWGQEKIPAEAGHHAHESPPTMTWPLVILAVGAVVVGALLELTHGLADFLVQTPSLAYVSGRPHHLEPAMEGPHTMIVVVSTVVALAGISLAALLYLGRRAVVARLAEVMDWLGLYRLSHKKFFLDEIYERLVVWPTLVAARVAAAFDRRVIDGLVDLVGQVPPAIGAMLRPLQGGLLQFYALAMLLGLLVLLGAMFI
jgi:NADH-quinone oxidoreductase subunit L